MKIKYDEALMKIMNLFDSITRAKLKDCIVTRSFIVFIVEPGEAGKAIGKGAKNARVIEKKLNKKIKIVEFSPDLIQFIKNYIAPIKAKEVKQISFGIIQVTPSDLTSRGLLIGRNAENLRLMEDIAKRYHTVTEIKIA